MNERGFTLIELLLTVGLISIMAGISFLSLRGMMTGYQMRGAARQVYGDMQTARLGAIKQGGDWGICFSPGDTSFTSYTIRNQAGPDRNLCTADDPVPYVRSVDFNVLFSGMTFNENFTGTNLPFSPRGSATNGNVTITMGTRTLQVTVNGTTGNVRILSP